MESSVAIMFTFCRFRKIPVSLWIVPTKWKHPSFEYFEPDFTWELIPSHVHDGRVQYVFVDVLLVFVVVFAVFLLLSSVCSCFCSHVSVVVLLTHIWLDLGFGQAERNEVATGSVGIDYNSYGVLVLLLLFVLVLVCSCFVLVLFLFVLVCSCLFLFVVQCCLFFVCSCLLFVLVCHLFLFVVCSCSCLFCSLFLFLFVCSCSYSWLFIFVVLVCCCCKLINVRCILMPALW